MRAITPREVVTILDRMFGDAPRRQQETWERTKRASDFAPVSAPDFGPTVAALYEMLERIPEGLITKRADEFLAAKAAIGHILGVWEQKRDAVLVPIRGFDSLHPVTLIRRSLDECPDAVPSEKTPFLPFLGDPDLAESLRLDISSAFASFDGQQWKATCVLAASAIEALLHWALKGRDSEFPGAEANARRRLASGFSLPADQTRSTLHHYTEVAVEVGVIEDVQAAKCRLARDARNLIHPGAEERKKAVCDRSGALSALAALDAVVDHLTRTRTTTP